VTKLVITKLDVLSEFDPVIVGHAYKIDGKITTDLPYDLEAQQIEVQYQEIPGWNEDITHARDFEELPSLAQDYVRFMENQTGVPAFIVSNGPGRDQVIQQQVTL